MEFMRWNISMKVKVLGIRKGIKEPEACLTLYRAIESYETRFDISDIIESIRMLNEAKGVEFSIHTRRLPELRRCFRLEVDTSEMLGSMAARQAAWNSLHHVRRDRLLLHLTKEGLLRVKEDEDNWII